MSRLLTLALLASLSLTATSETIIIPVGQQGAESSKPAKGQSKQNVLETFGEPQSKRGPTGEPPISTWSYSKFTVYFENDTVIHSVSQHKAKQ